MIINGCDFNKGSICRKLPLCPCENGSGCCVVHCLLCDGEYLRELKDFVTKLLELRALHSRKSMVHDYLGVAARAKRVVRDSMAEREFIEFMVENQRSTIPIFREN